MMRISWERHYYRVDPINIASLAVQGDPPDSDRRRQLLSDLPLDGRSQCRNATSKTWMILGYKAAVGNRGRRIEDTVIVILSAIRSFRRTTDCGVV